MDSSALPKPDNWSIGMRVSSAAECLSTCYQAYLERRWMILNHAERVFGSRSHAVEWFNKPARGLDYQPPCGVIVDEHGYQTVVDYLGRIEYGVY